MFGELKFLIIILMILINKGVFVITNQYTKEEIHKAAFARYEEMLVVKATFQDQLDSIAHIHSTIVMNKARQDLTKPSTLINHVTSSYLEEQAVIMDYINLLIRGRLIRN